MRSVWVKLVAAIMTVVFPVALMAGDNAAAMVYTNGQVKVNGNGLARSTALYAGDELQIEKGSVTIAAPGSTITVAGDAKVALRGNTLEMTQGAAVVRTDKRLAVRTQGVTVTPTSDSASYEIAQLDGAYKITARQGGLSVNDGKAMKFVAEGATMSSAAASPAPQANASNDDNRWKMIALWLGVAAGIAALAILTTNQPADVSPIVP